MCRRVDCKFFGGGREYYGGGGDVFVYGGEELGGVGCVVFVVWSEGYY